MTDHWFIGGPWDGKLLGYAPGISPIVCSFGIAGNTVTEERYIQRPGTAGGCVYDYQIVTREARPPRKEER